MTTQKERTDKPYATFGTRLAELRQQAGLTQQAELATRVRTTQQTISRWEAGLSRPRAKQIPQIAAALETTGKSDELKKLTNDLLRAAGYASAPTVVTSFDQLFPIDALSPESFERFSREFIEALYPEAEVHRAGASGHKQSGIDIEARFPNGDIFTFQCKRVDEFGPQKVHTAVAQDTRAGTKKFLLISRIASLQARDAIHKHPKWDIWDKEDISVKVRRLQPADKLHLVDTFFKGRRFELLGETEIGPWETTNQFFAPFENSTSLFNHVWDLVGRRQATDDLAKALADDEVRAILLVGSGGAGKTRVLKQAIEAYEAAHRDVTVRFLSRTGEVSKKALEELGSKPALIVVDDAHDRNDLEALFHFAASANVSTKLLLAFRPYGLDRIKAQASTFALIRPLVTEIILPPLSQHDAEELATQVLKKHSGPLDAAADIARLTLDCPLATVVGAQVVAKERTLFDLAKNEDSFRTTLFGRFQDVIAGEIGTKADAGPIKQVLKVLALLQPFHPDDPKLLAAIECVEKIPGHESNRLIRLLANGGVLFKRGAKYRLSPDVLSDYIIEANCIGAEGKSTGYAELIFDAIEGEHIENLLVNLGKLDWVRSNGNPSNSQLLDGVWGKLVPANEYADPAIRAVTAVAYYQPAKALDFAEGLIREGRFIDQLPELLKYAAYNLGQVVRACESLWQIGKADDRLLHRHTGHAIRVLGELCEVRPNKPYEYNEKIVDFGLSLIPVPESWRYRYTPLDIVAPILKTEAYTTSGNAKGITFKPFFINLDFVAKLRKRAIDAIIALLAHPDTSIAVLAARRIGEAIHYPMGMFGASVDLATRDKWTDAFAETLETIERATKSETVDPLVRYVIAREVAWHANHGPDKTGKIARRIRSGLPKGLEFRILSTLIDGYGIELRRIEAEDHLAKQEKRLDALIRDALAAYPNVNDLYELIVKQLKHLERNDPEKGASPFILCNKLVYADADFARLMVEDACSSAPSTLAKFVSAAAARLWQLNITEGREVIGRLFHSKKENLLAAIGDAYSRLDFSAGRHGAEEMGILEALLASEKPMVTYAAISALRSVAQADAAAAMGLALQTNVGSSKNLADLLAGLFTWPNEIPFDRLTDDDIDVLLKKLMAVPELDGHWLETFLALASKAFPLRVANFFMRRVDHAAQTGKWDYRPCNHGPYGHVPLRFKETQEYGPLLAIVVRWIKDAKYQGNNKIVFDYRSRELFETLFGSYDDEVIQHLDSWSAAANKNEMRLIANVLEEAPPNLVFNQASFVATLLERAKRLDKETLQRVSTALLGSAISGVRQGTPGEPFPRDLEMKANAENVLRSLSRFSLAYELYDQIRRHADRNIERARLDREALEE
jgi:transcriptional regulator with XRE-family HTH domain